MRLDRFAIDFLRWLHSLLWHQEGKVDRKVIEKIGSGIRGHLGILQQIRRYFPPDIPYRDVAVWVLYSFRYNAPKAEVFDIYVFCLHLGPVVTGVPAKVAKLKEGSRRKRNEPTHRFEVYRASHWLRPDYQFEGDRLFEGEFDCQGNSPLQHRHAVEITRSVVMLLKYRDVYSINWAFEIETSRRLVMGSDYTPPLTTYDWQKSISEVEAKSPQILKEGQQYKQD